MSRYVSYTTGDGSAGFGELTDDLTVRTVAPSAIAWLTGERSDGPTYPLAELTLLAPVPLPGSFRDFFAYEEHAATGAKIRGGELPDAWYQAPVFYFSNPASIVGPGASIRRPTGCERLDFELELGAVIGSDHEIAGFTLLNDWSARDIQLHEMAVGLGPAKGKDFATGLGPWLVTPDELPYEDGRLHLTAEVLIDGDIVSQTDAGKMHFTWPQLIARAAENTPGLLPGDVLGSGTLGRGCLLELIATGGRTEWLKDGQTVTLRAPGLGELRGTVTPS